MRFSPRVAPRAEGRTEDPVGATAPAQAGTASPVAVARGSDRVLADLLRDLGPRLRRGPALPDDEPVRDALGLPGVDRALGGGLPRGRVVEIAGPPSSGRTALALGWLARLTRAGEVVAVVDVADALDPPSAAAAGVVLSRLLWVRAPGLGEALRATERLLAARGFALVLLDLDAPDALDATAPAAAAPRGLAASGGEPGHAVWLRLARAAAASRTSLALLGDRRRAGTFSDLALELRPTGARFSPSPALLEGLDARAVLVRNRLGPPGHESPWELTA